MAALIDDQTENLKLPLPHPDNLQTSDCRRIRKSLEMVDAAIAENGRTTSQALAQKANTADIPAPATAAPRAPGTAAAGTSGKWAREDHVHAAQTIPQAASAAPKAHGTATVGTSSKFAREDHVHPSNNTDTHWTSHLYAGTSTGNANAATANGATHLIICDNSTVRDRRLIKGAGATSVTSDANGAITINSTNTTYGVATQSANGLLSAADKKKLDGIAAGAQVNNTNVTPRTGNRGAMAGSEEAAALTNSQTININTRDCCNISTTGAVTLTFQAAGANVAAVKLLTLKAAGATTLTISGAVWASNGPAPVWGTAGKILVLAAFFTNGRVVLNVVDNTQA